MKKEKLSSNTFYWLIKSKGSKECVDLPYYEGITVSYIIIYNYNKCSSGN